MSAALPHPAILTPLIAVTVLGAFFGLPFLVRRSRRPRNQPMPPPMRGPSLAEPQPRDIHPYASDAVSFGAPPDPRGEDPEYGRNHQ